MGCRAIVGPRLNSKSLSLAGRRSRTAKSFQMATSFLWRVAPFESRDTSTLRLKKSWPNSRKRSWKSLRTQKLTKFSSFRGKTVQFKDKTAEEGCSFRRKFSSSQTKIIKVVEMPETTKPKMSRPYLTMKFN
jgi:hypothetical protein